MITGITQQDRGETGDQHDRRHDQCCADASKRFSNRFLVIVGPLSLFQKSSQEVNRVINCDS